MTREENIRAKLEFFFKRICELEQEKGRENMSINNLQYNKMLEEYRKDGSFSEYVKKCMRTYGTTLREELHKQITWEYYKAIEQGVNK